MLGDSVRMTTRETMTATTRETRRRQHYRVSTMADMINKFKNGEIVKNMDDTIRRQTEMNRGKLDSPNAEDNKEGHTGIKRICI
jgi:hypothetical protein